MLGLMQNWPLTVDRILDHANAAFPNSAASDAASTTNAVPRRKEERPDTACGVNVMCLLGLHGRWGSRHGRSLR